MSLFVRKSVFTIATLVAVIVVSLVILRKNEQEVVRSPCEMVSFEYVAQPCVLNVWDDLSRQAEDSPIINVKNVNVSVNRRSVEQARQLWEKGFVPLGRKVELWPFQLPLNWNADPFEDRNWRYQLHAWRMLDHIIGAWEQTSDPKYLGDALRILFDWYEYHVVREQNSDYEWYDMAVGLRSMKLAYLLQRAFEGSVQVDYAGKEKLIHLAWLHAQNLMDKRLLSRGNHGLFQLHGLLALCIVVPSIATCEGSREFVEVEMQDLLLRQFSREGVHLESAPEYHFFVYKTVKRFMDTGWYDQFGSVKELMARVEQNRAWMVHPDKTIVTVGDSEPKRVNIEWPEPSAQCAGMEASCYMLRNFEESGYAIVRSDWSAPKENASMLFFMGMFFQTGHKLPDDLSFEWFDQGERILTNAGKYSYSKGPFRDYVTSTAAHNTVEIDDRTTKVSKFEPYGSAVTEAKAVGEAFLLRGAVAREEGIRHERFVLFKPNRWLVIADDLQGSASHKYAQWFHFARQWQLQGTNGRTLLKSPSGRTLVVRHDSGGQVVAARGQKQPKLQGWVTESYGNMVDRQALGFTAEGQAVRLVTLFGFDEAAINEAAEAAQTHLSAEPGHSVNP